MKEKPHRRIRVKTENTAENSARTLPNQGRGDILSDVLGSYTGMAQNYEAPEQDADDL